MKNTIQAKLIKAFNSGAIKAQFRGFTCDFQPSVAKYFILTGDGFVTIPIQDWIEQKAYQNYEWNQNPKNPKNKTQPHYLDKPNGVKGTASYAGGGYNVRGQNRGSRIHRISQERLNQLTKNLNYPPID